MKRTVKLGIATSGIAILCLIMAACVVTAKDCANGVNKYANALSAFQDGAIKLHDQKLIADPVYVNILHAEKAASKAGRDLDAGIALAVKGADPKEYVTLAQAAFDDMLLQLDSVVDPATQDKLNLSAQLAGDALKNAISLIEALRASKPTIVQLVPHSPERPPDPGTPVVTNLSTRSPHSLPLWVFSLPLIGLVAGAGVLAGVDATLKLLQVVVTLEPVAFDLILKFATSLKGKSEAEILAMNEQIFGKVDATADAELGKMGKT